MIVISDTSALSALAELGWLDLLPRIHGPITITASVRKECLHPRAPTALHAWLASPPEFGDVLESARQELARLQQPTTEA